MNTKTFFDDKLPQVLQSKADKAHGIGGRFLFKIDGAGGGNWTVDLNADPPTVTVGDQSDVDCEVQLSDSDFDSLLEDTSRGMSMFMQGKISVSNPLLATKLIGLLELV